MNSYRSSIGEDPGGVSSMSDRRAAFQREELERETLRKEQLALQSSPLKTPEERIRLWEQLHAIRLPVAATHKLVRVIATQTELSVQAVQREQRRRAGVIDEPVAFGSLT
jgi:hypothetical protein